MRFLKSLLVAVFIAIALVGPALADAAGIAKGVDQEARATLDHVTRILRTGDEIFLGDTIVTGPKGAVQMLFADNTKLVIGPNSSLTIDDYLIRGDGSAGKLALNMLGGTFRFITGTSPKSSYDIQTPTGTIGIRGTAFDVFVEENGISHVLMYLGTTFLATYGGDNETVNGQCQVGEINDDTAEIIGNASGFTGDDRKALKAWFKYSLNQSSLLKEFWLQHALDCTHRPPTSGGPQSLLASSGGGGGPTTDCSAGFHDEGGVCVPDPLQCSPGTHEFGGVCVPDPLECSPGTHEAGGVCVPDETDCASLQSPLPNDGDLFPIFVSAETGFDGNVEFLLATVPIDPCGAGA